MYIEVDVVDSLPPPTLSQQMDTAGPPLSTGGSLTNITVYANDTLFGSEPSDVLNGTPSTPRTLVTNKVKLCVVIQCLISLQVAAVKREVKEDIVEEVSISLPPDNTTTGNNGLTQPSTDRTNYFEPQHSSVDAPSTNCAPVEAREEKIAAVPSSPDGLSCSPSTFHSSLPSTNTSVIIPSTFTQKSSKDKVLT